MMVRPAALVTVFTATSASTAFADPDRQQVDAVLARSLGEVKDCGNRPKGVYDWNAYDAIDWRAAGKDKREFLSSERGTLGSLGRAITALCADADYRAILAKVATIVYVPTGDRATKLVAVVAGTTLTFRNYIFGSTRDVDDFADAARRALDSAPVAAPAPAAPKTPAPAVGAPASSGWDGTYAVRPSGASGGICPREDLVGALTVARGRFSFPWFVENWTGAARDANGVKVGRIDGVVHADGSATTTVTFAEPVLKDTTLKTVRVKRALDAVKTVPIVFTRDRDAKLATLDAQLPSREHCHISWRLDPPPPPPPPVTAKRDPPRSSPPPPPPKRDDTVERTVKASNCKASCSTREDQCKYNRCEATDNRCRDRCEPLPQGSDERRDCFRDCIESSRECRSACNDDGRSCRLGCENQ